MIEQLKEDTYTFNTIAGTVDELNDTAFIQQYEVLVEEVKEIGDALVASNLVEVVDGVIDTLVVALGLWQKLENKGVDMNKAAELIAANNLSKYPSLTKSEVVDATIEMYKAKNIEVEVTSNIPYHCYVFRNKVTGKILKPYGFESVDISSCIPEEFQIE